MSNLPNAQPQRPETVVVANAFVLTDDSGAVRARLAMNKDNCPELRMWDANGVLRLDVGLGHQKAGDEFTTMCLRHPNGMPALDLSAAPGFGVSIEATTPDDGVIATWPPERKARNGVKP